MNKIRIAFLNNDDLKFEPKIKEHENFELGFEIDRFKSSDDLIEGLAKKNYSLIISAEVNLNVCRAKYFKLYKELPNYEKVKWLNIFDAKDKNDNDLAWEILNFYKKTLSAQKPIFFSIITPLYHTRHTDFVRAYNSLKKQTCVHWEWILVDDSKNKKLTEFAKQYAKKDFRIKYFNIEHSGIIGNVKNIGFSLARGEYLLELDHDDIILPEALEKCLKAFENPEIGFVYSDCLEVNIDSRDNILGTRTYSHDKDGNAIPGNWGYSNTGSHYYYNYKGHELLAARSPSINPQSIRHITSSPNHLRCWRADVYKKIKGHDYNIHIADDYELMVRTFLETKFCRINSVQYIQHYLLDNNNNTQYARYGEIQRLTHYISSSYDKKIHDRILELGAEDYCWDSKSKMSTYWYDYGDKAKNYTLNEELE